MGAQGSAGRRKLLEHLRLKWKESSKGQGGRAIEGKAAPAAESGAALRTACAQRFWSECREGGFTVCAVRSDFDGLDSQCELFCCTEKLEKRQEVKEKVSVH